MDYIIEILLGLVVILTIVILIIITRRKPLNLEDLIYKSNTRLIEKMIKENSDVKLEISNSIGRSSKEQVKDLNEFKDNLNESISMKFKELNDRIEYKMNQINTKVESRLDEGFERTNKTFTSIVERLTRIDEAQKNIYLFHFFAIQKICFPNVLPTT